MTVASKLQSLILIGISLSGCATQKYLNAPGHGAFMRGDYEVAAGLFEREIPKTNTNKLLFELDSGTSYFNAGDFNRALPHFLNAVKFWESKDYTSITETAASFAVSENVKTYVGEDYERVLIHVFLALSYAGLNKIEDAQVEARRIDLLLKKMRNEEKKNYSESAFARFLSGILWEATGSFDNARIDYEAAYAIDANFPGIRKEILRACRTSGDDDRYDYWKKKWPGEAPVRAVDTKKSELVVFITYGLSPIKTAPGGQNSLPVLYPRPWTPATVEAEIGSEHVTDAKIVFDIEDLTNKFFETKLKWLSARKLITLGGKAGAAFAVAKLTKHEELGWLAFIAMSAMDTTDLRGWNTLPAGVRMMRIPVEPGFHSLKFTIKGAAGTVIRNVDLGQRRFLPGEKAFVVLHEG